MLKALYKSDSDIPEGLGDYYKQDGDNWILEVDGQESGLQLENVNGLKSALQSERNEAKTLKETLARYDGLKPEDILALKQKSVVADTSSTEITNLKSNYSKKLSDLQSELSKKDKTMNDYLLNAEINRVLSNEKLVDNGAKLLRPHIQGNLKVIEGKVKPVDANGNPMISNLQNNLGDMTLDEYVGNMKSNEVYSSLFRAEVIQGTGSKTETNGNIVVKVEGNPYIEKNLTERCRLEKNNPQEAQRMKAEADAYFSTKK